MIWKWKNYKSFRRIAAFLIVAVIILESVGCGMENSGSKKDAKRRAADSKIDSSTPEEALRLAHKAFFDEDYEAFDALFLNIDERIFDRWEAEAVKSDYYEEDLRFIWDLDREKLLNRRKRLKCIERGILNAKLAYPHQFKNYTAKNYQYFSEYGDDFVLMSDADFDMYFFTAEDTRIICDSLSRVKQSLEKIYRIEIEKVACVIDGWDYCFDGMGNEVVLFRVDGKWYFEYFERFRQYYYALIN